MAADFKLIDVWALPASGTLEEFADLRDLFANLEPGQGSDSRLSNGLFALREWLGERFGWDDRSSPPPIPGCEETLLRDRLPADLRSEEDADVNGLEFRPVYATPTESASEISNSTVHAVLHLGWVERKDGSYRGQMGVYVKPRGRLGPFYMTLIAPFRHLIVYPALMRRIDHVWKTRA